MLSTAPRLLFVDTIEIKMFSPDLRERMRARYEDMRSYRAVAKIFNVHPFTVKRAVENLYIESKSHTGAPRKTTERDERKIARVVAKIKSSGSQLPLER